MADPAHPADTADAADAAAAARATDAGRAVDPSRAGDQAHPDAFDVLVASRHPAARVVDLGDRAVVRTPSRPDDPAGNALHLTAGRADPDALAAGLAEARTRLADPRATPRVVARGAAPPADPGADATDPEPAAGSAGHPAVGDVRHLDVLVLPDAARTVSDWPLRHDLRVRPPADPRAWHGVTVLQRHATGDDAVEAAARARGGRDELLRWRVDGRRRMVRDGRARVLLGERFGTPVGAATLVWAPSVPVGPDAAGLAVVTDVVVHPAHRGLGIATSLARALVETHLADFPRARVATVAPAALRPVLTRRGWRVHDRLVAVVDPRGPQDAGP